MISLLAFLLFNFNPAKIFMGDTGSLAMGAAFSGMAILLHNPWILISLGGVYVLETVSVMVQVMVYKKNKTRIFKMAPLHHHFELLGLSERKTVGLFWMFGLIFLGIFFLNQEYFVLKMLALGGL